MTVTEVEKQMDDLAKMMADALWENYNVDDESPKYDDVFPNLDIEDIEIGDLQERIGKHLVVRIVTDFKNANPVCKVPAISLEDFNTGKRPY